MIVNYPYLTELSHCVERSLSMLLTLALIFVLDNYVQLYTTSEKRDELSTQS